MYNVEQLQEQLIEVIQENRELKDRLEYNKDFPDWDGISCRDETIRNLEVKIDNLKSQKISSGRN